MWFFGDNWTFTFTRLIVLTGGPGVGRLPTDIASMVWGIPVYDGVNCTAFILLKTRFCVRHKREAIFVTRATPM